MISIDDVTFLVSLKTLAREIRHVDQIQSILCAMLGESSTRPTAREVAQGLLKVTTPAPPTICDNAVCSKTLLLRVPIDNVYVAHGMGRLGI